MSTDVDECVRGLHSCREDSEACFNVAGSYKCGCQWGYLFDTDVQKCVKNDALITAETGVYREDMTIEKGKRGKAPNSEMPTFIRQYQE
jgi:hypothetical protein